MVVLVDFNPFNGLVALFEEEHSFMNDVSIRLEGVIQESWPCSGSDLGDGVDKIRNSQRNQI